MSNSQDYYTDNYQGHSAPQLRVENLCFSYKKSLVQKSKKRKSRSLINIAPTRKPKKTEYLLKNISFDIFPGELTILGGDSGCGKSTLLRLIAGFEKPLNGNIYYQDVLFSSSSVCIAPERRGIGLLLQDHALFPQMNVEKNIQFGIAHLSKEEQYEKTIDMLNKIKLVEYAHKYPDELSIGQIQRVALARALVMDPWLLLLDEPFSSLDVHTSFELIEEIQEIKLSNTSILMVTHESLEAMYLADKIMLMNKGEIIQEGSPQNLYDHPKNGDIAKYFDEINFIPIQQSICGQLCSPCGFIKDSHITNYADLKDIQHFYLCIRPHMVQIKSSTKARYQQENWIVKKKYFMGNHYKIIVESQHPSFNGLKIKIVQSIHSRWPQEGEIIQLQITDDKLWGLVEV